MATTLSTSNGAEDSTAGNTGSNTEFRTPNAAWPINLRAKRSAGRAVLLIHGFGDTPQTLQYLAGYLHAHHYDVRVPLLPGHGQTIAAFDRATHTEWIEAMRTELISMRSEYPWVGVCGLSMGGAIAATLAGELHDLPSLCLIAPYLGMPLYAQAVAVCYRLFALYPHPYTEESPLSIRDPIERAKNLAYGGVTPHAVHELWKTMRAGRRALPKISTPTLIIQSKSDNRVTTKVAERSFQLVGARKKRLVLTEEGGHVITVDYGRERVFEEVRNWLGGGPGASPPTPETLSDIRHKQSAHD